MADELIDIVDERNVPTGETKLRSEVHSTGLWHRTVHIYVYRKKNDVIELVVQLRSLNKDLNPNKWDTRFGGHLKSRQTEEEALYGELKEEAGLEIQKVFLSKGKLLKRAKVSNNEFTQVYYYNCNNCTDAIIGNDGEVQKVEWLSIDEILQRMQEHPDEWVSNPQSFQQVISDLKKLL